MISEVQRAGVPASGRFFDSFPILKEMRQKDFYTTPNRTATALLSHVTTNRVTIWSIVCQDEESLVDLMRMILADKDRLNEIVTIDLIKNRLTDSERRTLTTIFGFEPSRAVPTILTRDPQDLSETAFEVVPGIETDEKITIVNKDDRRQNCYVVRNLYFENLSVFQTDHEAEVFYHIMR